MKNKYLCVIGLGLLSSATKEPTPDQESYKNKPNIILIMADDLGYECIGANSSEYYKTPNLDHLAETGTRFKHCYSQPLSTPSRIQLMTGRYNHRNYERFTYLNPKEITFANLLSEVGYATVIAGKWQLAGGLDAPNHFGFDEYCLYQVVRRPHRYLNPGLEINGELIDYSNGEYGPDIVSDYLIDFIQRHKDVPFFAYYPMILVHRPLMPTPDSESWSPDYPQCPDRWGNDEYFKDMVEYMDKIIGKIVDALNELNIRDNTLIIFTSDNGTIRGIESPFKDGVIIGDKGRTTNAGTHVPLIANWPKKMHGGTINDDLIDFSDFLPTLVELAGAELPDDRIIDGRSFAAQLKGKTGNPREWIFSWHKHIRDTFGIQIYSRTKDYKLYSDGRFYDMNNDELELNKLDTDNLDKDARQNLLLLQSILDKMYPYESDLVE